MIQVESYFSTNRWFNHPTSTSRFQGGILLGDLWIHALRRSFGKRKAVGKSREKAQPWHDPLTSLSQCSNNINFYKVGPHQPKKQVGAWKNSTFGEITPVKQIDFRPFYRSCKSPCTNCTDGRRYARFTISVIFQRFQKYNIFGVGFLEMMDIFLGSILEAKSELKSRIFLVSAVNMLQTDRKNSFSGWKRGAFCVSK